MHTYPVAKDKQDKRDKKSKKGRQDKKPGHEEHAPVAPPEATRDEGSFTYGVCKDCDWRGKARRSRDKARADAKDHEKSCKGSHKVKLKTTDHRG